MLSRWEGMVGFFVFFWGSGGFTMRRFRSSLLFRELVFCWRVGSSGLGWRVGEGCS